MLRERRNLSIRITGKSVYFASVSDPYQPEEAKLGLTRGCLEIFVRYRPRRLVLQTRGPLIERDMDLLQLLGPAVIVSFSMSSDSDEVRRAMEPNCASIDRRWKTISRLHAAGLRVYVTLAPVLPVEVGQICARGTALAEGVIVSGLTDDGAYGRNLRQPAATVLQERGWNYCLGPTYALDIWRKFEAHLCGRSEELSRHR